TPSGRCPCSRTDTGGSSVRGCAPCTAACRGPRTRADSAGGRRTPKGLGTRKASSLSGLVYKPKGPSAYARGGRRRRSSLRLCRPSTAPRWSQTKVQTHDVQSVAPSEASPAPASSEARLAARAAAGAGRRRSRGWLVRRALLTADVVGLAAAFLVGEGLIRLRGDRPIDLRIESLFFGLSIPVFVVLAKIYGLYDRDDERTNHSTVDDFVGVFHLCTVAVWLLYAGAWATGITHPPVEKLLFFWLAAIVLLPVSRSVARTLSRRSTRYLQNTIVVGAGEVGQLVGRKLRQHEEYGIRLLGFVDAEPRPLAEDVEEAGMLGTLEELPELVQALEVDRVVIAFSRDS